MGGCTALNDTHQLLLGVMPGSGGGEILTPRLIALRSRTNARPTYEHYRNYVAPRESLPEPI
jgi:hypothetical protein